MEVFLHLLYIEYHFGENIVYKHSFCPNCKEKLKFKDLIPILSYIFLGGKCAYCGQKIRIRYLLLEVLSGLVFLLFAFSLRVNFNIISINWIIYIMLFMLYIATLFIIAGIDKENIKIEKSLLVFGMLLSSCYMTYVCIQNSEAIYTYIIYLTITALLLVADTLFMKKKHYQSYLIECLMLLLYMMIFSGSKIVYFTIILALLCIAIYALCNKLKNSRKKKPENTKNDNLKIPIGFYLCVSNITVILIYNFLYNWVIL